MSLTSHFQTPQQYYPLGSPKGKNSRVCINCYDIAVTQERDGTANLRLGGHMADTEPAEQNKENGHQFSTILRDIGRRQQIICVIGGTGVALPVRPS